MKFLQNQRNVLSADKKTTMIFFHQTNHSLHSEMNEKIAFPCYHIHTVHSCNADKQGHKYRNVSSASLVNFGARQHKNAGQTAHKTAKTALTFPRRT